MRGFLVAGALLLSLSPIASAQSVPCESLEGGYRECRVSSSGVIRMT